MPGHTQDNASDSMKQPDPVVSDDCTCPEGMPPVMSPGQEVARQGVWCCRMRRQQRCRRTFPSGVLSTAASWHTTTQPSLLLCHVRVPCRYAHTIRAPQCMHCAERLLQLDMSLSLMSHVYNMHHLTIDYSALLSRSTLDLTLCGFDPGDNSYHPTMQGQQTSWVRC